MHPTPASMWYVVGAFGAWVLLIAMTSGWRPAAAPLMTQPNIPRWNMPAAYAPPSMATRIAWAVGATVVAILWLAGWMLLSAGRL